jgi:hypothetical protein
MRRQEARGKNGFDKMFENCSASYIFKMGKKSLENIFKKGIIPYWNVFAKTGLLSKYL